MVDNKDSFGRNGARPASPAGQQPPPAVRPPPGAQPRPGTEIAVAAQKPAQTASAGPIKLSELEFTDIFISESGRAFLRGLDDSEGPLVAIPPNFIDDIGELHRIVCTRGQQQKEFSLEFKDMRFRVTRIPSQGEITYTLRRSKWPIPRLGDLGLPAPIVSCLGQLGKKHGLLLIAGGMGHGKTTTACSLLQEYLLYYGDVAYTVEDPPEMQMDGKHGSFGWCFQTHAENGDYAEAMRLAMRSSARYILLGEVRGSKEASAAIKAATNGHLVITTIHAGSVESAITSLLKFVAGSEDISLASNILASGIVGVIHQQLISIKGGRRILKPQVLFPGNDHAIRTHIRENKIEMLSSAIQRQQQAISQGKMPVDQL